MMSRTPPHPTTDRQSPAAGALAALRLTPSGRAASRTRAAAGALLRLARGLAPADRLAVDFVFGDDPDQPVSVDVALVAGAASNGTQSPGLSDGASSDLTQWSAAATYPTPYRSLPSGDALRQAATLALPGLDIHETPSGPRAWHASEARLRPVPVTPLEYADALRRRSGNALPEPDPVPKAACHRLALAHPDATPARLVNALHLLAGLEGPATLGLECRAVALEAADLRPIGLVTGMLQKSLDDWGLHLPEHMIILEGLRRLEAWQGSSAGIAVDLRVSTPAPLEPWLITCLEDALFASTSADARDFEIDLCIAAPDSAPAPVQFPATGALDHLRRLRAERLRARPCAAAHPGTPIGRTDAGRRVIVPDAVRAQGLYITGATGTGKSTLLAHMIRCDLEACHGLCVIDPHGDLFDEIAMELTPATMERAMIADLSERGAPFTLNLLEPEGRAPERHRNFVCNQLIGAFKRLYRDVPEGFGPMFDAYFRNALLLLMEAEGAEATLLDLDRVFTEAKWRREALERCTDPNVHRFWRGIATRAGGDATLENIAPYIVSKLTQFTGNPALRPVLCAPRSSLDFAAAMAEGRPCLVNLAKGAVGEADAALIGALITTKLFGAALQRAALPRDARRPFRLYLDEFQGYASSLLGAMLAEGRKFGLETTLANQSLAQIDGRNRSDDVAHAVLSNCASLVAFRGGPADAATLAPWLGGDVSARELTDLGNHRVVARLGDPSGPPRLARLRTPPPG